MLESSINRHGNRCEFQSLKVIFTGVLLLLTWERTHLMYSIHQFGCEILIMVGPKKQKFWPKINYSRETIVFYEYREHDFRKLSGSKIEVRKKCFLQQMVS